MGRAGRTRPGTCYHLYSREDLEYMRPHPTPEMQRVGLEHILLHLTCLMPEVDPQVFIRTALEPPAEDQVCEH